MRQRLTPRSRTTMPCARRQGCRPVWPMFGCGPKNRTKNPRSSYRVCVNLAIVAASGKIIFANYSIVRDSLMCVLFGSRTLVGWDLSSLSFFAVCVCRLIFVICLRPNSNCDLKCLAFTEDSRHDSVSSYSRQACSTVCGSWSCCHSHTTE